MLKNELKEQAERIAEQVAPLFATAYKLGKKYDQTRREQSKAENRANSWNHPNERLDWDYIDHRGQTKQEREEIRALFKDNPRDWSAKVSQMWENCHNAEARHTVARINFNNFLNYMARYLGDLIRPIWRELIDRHALLSLADYINEKNHKKDDHSAGAVWVGLYLTNCEIDKNDARKVGQWARIEAHIWTGWACGISGECSRYYQINPDEVWHFAELPPLLTIKQYQKNAAKISQKVKEIETARDQLAEFAKACGLLGYVEIVGTIQKTK